MSNYRKRFADARARITADEGDKLTIETVQEIPDDFFDRLADDRLLTAGNAKLGEFVRVASVPAILVNKWFRQGFNIYQASWPEIRKKLHEEDAGRLFATTRSI